MTFGLAMVCPDVGGVGDSEERGLLLARRETEKGMLLVMGVYTRVRGGSGRSVVMMGGAAGRRGIPLVCICGALLTRSSAGGGTRRGAGAELEW